MPAIRNWTDAIGDASPLYTDAEFAARSVHGQLVAPPAMVQVWTMPGLQPQPPAATDADPLGQMMTALDEAGFTSVVATNCAQTYHRYLRHGELLSLRAELTDVSGPKPTALGEGWFVTTRNVWYSGDEAVAEMDWRVLKFRPRLGETHLRSRCETQPSATTAAAAGPGRQPSPRRAAARTSCGRRCRRTPSSSGPAPGRRAAHPALRRMRRAAAPAGTRLP